MDHGIPMTPAFVGWGLFVPVTFFGLVGLFRSQVGKIYFCCVYFRLFLGQGLNSY